MKPAYKMLDEQTGRYLPFVYPEELKDTKRITVFRDFIVAKAKEWSF